MEIVQSIIQIIIPLGIYNVWFLRSKHRTAYRGGGAQNLREEFAAYGLPVEVYYIIGFLKISSASLLLVGLFFPVMVLPAALMMALLMIGAVCMHAKVRDPALRYLPASVMLIMSLFLLF